ncbi:sulfatase domain-containing protein [Hirsutella rhossiliensis]|uniref:Arylsulfatase n=1 Tax=Hirsutella rhossiliensis TaxID=111463 RepID=A0A9P8N5B9_9HYPO|nr:sulfatase domain-containing protein [Hirsutella rhossiliensis]KAH0967135.1 sulfatase domain-containing protein [Hirsutella rhossiliensis]
MKSHFVMGVVASSLLSVVALAASPDAPPAPRTHSSGKRQKQPNFVFIMTDDQDLHLGSLEYQPVVQEQFLKKGTAFKKHFCTAAHNTNVTHVIWPYGGFRKFVDQGLNEQYLPVWLQQFGYNTYYAGKLMNGHSVDYYDKPRPAGWTRSNFLIDPKSYDYWNPSMVLDDGEVQSHEGKYSTDLVANSSTDFLDDALAAGKPFFLGVAPIGPHSGPGFSMPSPAERHKDMFPGVKVPRKENFNPDQIRSSAVNYFGNLPKISDDHLEYYDEFYRARLQSLQAVDDLVASIISKLEANPEVLENTYLFYTTDNGYHIGQHRLPPGKTCSIEEDINIPFIVRGPGIAAGEVAKFPTSHTDVVPTLFDLAGIPLHNDFDGVPIPVTKENQQKNKLKPEHVTVEYWGPGLKEGDKIIGKEKIIHQNTYKALRVIGDGYDLSYTVYCTNEHELYDITDDPFQMNNLYVSELTKSGFKVPELVARLDALLVTLKNCKGRTCQHPWETLFPNEEAASLRDAMDAKYDSFFKKQEKVEFLGCNNAYIPELEGPLGSQPFTVVGNEAKQAQIGEDVDEGNHGEGIVVPF